MICNLCKSKMIYIGDLKGYSGIMHRYVCVGDCDNVQLIPFSDPVPEYHFPHSDSDFNLISVHPDPLFPEKDTAVIRNDLLSAMKKDVDAAIESLHKIIMDSGMPMTTEEGEALIKVCIRLGRQGRLTAKQYLIASLDIAKTFANVESDIEELNKKLKVYGYGKADNQEDEYFDEPDGYYFLRDEE